MPCSRTSRNQKRITGAQVRSHVPRASCYHVVATGLDAMRSALDLEKEGYDQLLHLHKVADEHSDYDVSNSM